MLGGANLDETPKIIMTRSTSQSISSTTYANFNRYNLPSSEGAGCCPVARSRHRGRYSRVKVPGGGPRSAARLARELLLVARLVELADPLDEELDLARALRLRRDARLEDRRRRRCLRSEGSLGCTLEEGRGRNDDVKARPDSWPIAAIVMSCIALV